MRGLVIVLMLSILLVGGSVAAVQAATPAEVSRAMLPSAAEIGTPVTVWQVTFDEPVNVDGHQRGFISPAGNRVVFFVRNVGVAAAPEVLATFATNMTANGYDTFESYQWGDQSFSGNLVLGDGDARFTRVFRSGGTVGLVMLVAPAAVNSIYVANDYTTILARHVLSGG